MLVRTKTDKCMHMDHCQTHALIRLRTRRMQTWVHLGFAQRACVACKHFDQIARKEQAAQSSVPPQVADVAAVAAMPRSRLSPSLAHAQQTSDRVTLLKRRRMAGHAARCGGRAERRRSASRPCQLMSTYTHELHTLPSTQAAISTA
jgi:hypothetical protein